MTLLAFTTVDSARAEPRVLGLDVSAWQGHISQATWNNIHNVENRDFAFIRSSRGGTTGFYNQSDPKNNNGQNTLSQRYDDPYFALNINRATDAGMLAGAYHFARPDIAGNTGADEANHFYQMAGPWMRPGYLLPVFDLEAGDGVRTNNELAEFSIEFSDRIHELAGVRPAIYTNVNYAQKMQSASPELRQEVVAAYPVFWSARPEYNDDPDTTLIQTLHPKNSYSTAYGPWDDRPNPAHPWSFWQYSWYGRLDSFNNGNSNLDFNVAQGGVEFLKDHLVPALWTTAGDGQWTDLANWNSGQPAFAPVHGPGQVPRIGRLSLPTARLPGADDTVILDRPSEEVTITLSSGVQSIRKLEVRETLEITGGSLALNYVPSPDSTPYSARFSAPVTVDGGSFSAHTLDVDAGQTFSLGGALAFNQINLTSNSTAPAKIELIGDTHLDPWGDETATIVFDGFSTGPGFVDMGDAPHDLHIGDGPAVVDVQIDAPIVGGALIKTGPGTLALSGGASYVGDTTVDAGLLRLEGPTLADEADVYLSTGAALEIPYVGVADVINSLFIDGTAQPAGRWGALGSGAQFTTPLITGVGQLLVTNFAAPLAGDFDHDGDVDSDDLDHWQAAFGESAMSGADLLAWQRNLSPSAAELAVSRPVPEPAAIPLAILGAAAAISCRPRR